MPQASHDTMPELALHWLGEGRRIALATVVETWGSAPRPAGSQLVISDSGDMMGSVSGGCVEGAVVHAALEALDDGIPRLLTFGVTDETAFSVGLACGGKISVLVEPVGDGPQAFPAVLLKDLVDARAAKRPVALAVQTQTFERHLVNPTEGAAGPAITARLRADKSGLEDDGWFIAVHNPPLRMVIVGAVHIAQPLVAMARMCGYDPVLIDPRGAFGSEARFPGETIVDDWPDEAVAALSPDARTAIVTLTHDPKLDDPALMAAFASKAFYIGCLGSTRTHSKRLDRLRDQGIDEVNLARLHAPVGLNIGAKSPAEIAVSIMAQITQVLRQD